MTNNIDFLKQTAFDYDMDIEIVKSISNKNNNITEFYKNLEIEYITT